MVDEQSHARHDAADLQPPESLRPEGVHEGRLGSTFSRLAVLAGCSTRSGLDPWRQQRVHAPHAPSRVNRCAPGRNVVGPPRVVLHRVLAAVSASGGTSDGSRELRGLGRVRCLLPAASPLRRAAAHVVDRTAIQYS